MTRLFVRTVRHCLVSRKLPANRTCGVDFSSRVGYTHNLRSVTHWQMQGVGFSEK